MSTAERQPDDRPLPAWIGRVSRVSWAFLGLVGAIAVVIFVLGALRELVIPLVLAAFLATVFAPAVDWLAWRRVPRAFGAVLVIAGIAIAIALSATIVVVGIVDRSDDLTRAFDDAQDQLADISSQWNLDDLLDEIRSGDEAGSTVRDGISRQVTTVLGSAVAFASGLVLGVVLLYYLLKDGAALVRSAARRRTPKSSEQTERVLVDAARSIRSYFRGRTILALVQGVAVALALWVLDVPLAGSIGVVNFVGAFVPYLGAVLGGAFAVLMGLAGGGTTLALLALAVVLFVNLVLENLLEPKVMGSSLDLHPVLVLLATVGGGLLAGIVGLILGAPLLAIGRDLFAELRSSGFFGTPGVVPTSSRATGAPTPDAPSADAPDGPRPTPDG
jgi:predicted PurR-regulated permease PerM